MQESTLREQICELGRSIFERGLTHGSTGNISARCADGWLLTPTGSNLGRLDPARLSKLDWNGKLISGDAPSQGELPAPRDVPGAREEAAPSSICTPRIRWRCRCSTASIPNDLLPPLTAYYVMRIGTLPLVPYYAPGDWRWPRRCAATPGGITRCCSPTTGRSSPAPRSPPPPTRSRNWRRRRSSS